MGTIHGVGEAGRRTANQLHNRLLLRLLWQMVVSFGIKPGLESSDRLLGGINPSSDEDAPGEGQGR